MQRAFLPPSRWTGEEVLLDEGESKHLAGVMRLEAGAEVELLDGAGRVGRGRVVEARRKGVRVALEETRTVLPPPPRRVLVQAIPREQKMDWLIQKAVELSVSAIVPVQTAHCVARVARGEEEKKARRWREIAVSACKQSGNPWLPEISPVTDLRSVLEGGAGWLANAAFGALRPGARPLPAWLKERKTAGAAEVAAFVGPEGDFSEEESDAMLAAGVAPVTLGPIVFRVETAAIFMLSAVQYEWMECRGRCVEGASGAS
jgi:16S rRNA (uracil1498-N3)-methyltransferase